MALLAAVLIVASYSAYNTFLVDAGAPRGNRTAAAGADTDTQAQTARASDTAAADQALAAPNGDVPIAPPPEAFDEPPAVQPPPPALKRTRFGNVTPSGGTWAVMIGVNDYPGTRHDLRSAVADAADVNEALARMGVPGDHRLVISNGQATAATIKLAAEWLVAHAGEDAVAVFFYAGHVRKLSSKTEAILAADGKLVHDVDLAAALRPLKAKRAWIAIAACYSGGFTETLAPGRVLTAASNANSLAYENTSFGRSYLVQYMVREAMIDNRAPASVQTSFDYANAAIARDYPGREPVQFDHGAGPLSLRPPAAGPAPAPQPKPTSSNGPAPQQQPAPPPSQPSSPPPPKDCKGVQLGGIKCR